MFGAGGVAADETPNTAPHYFDNPYWMRYNNYNSDTRIDILEILLSNMTGIKTLIYWA